MKLRLALLSLLCAACSSTGPSLEREPAPDAEQRARDVRAADEKRRDFQAVLVRLDQSLDSYVQALSNQGQVRADRQVEQLAKSIRDTVLDLGPTGYGASAPPTEAGANFGLLQAAAGDGSDPNRQAIALAALGFSGRTDLMPLIVQGAQLEDPFRVDHAVLGLAVLRAPTTPPGVLAAIAERRNHPEDGRVQAAWALYEIQQVNTDQAPFAAIWRRWLGEARDELPIGVLVSAVRGLGLSRSADDAKLVAPMLKHPTPRLRMAAAIALARMNAQDYAPDLIDLLGPQETVPNVRLHARKALADLAGGQDHGYDVAAWHKVFERAAR